VTETYDIQTAEKVGTNGQYAAPRTPEQLIGAAGMGSGRRPARAHGYEQRGLAYLPTSPLYEGRFGRMFRLPPYLPDADRIAEVAALMTENGTGADNPAIPAGYTYLGQFLDHDITFDPTSSLDRQNDPDALTDFRTPRFDLDSVYGRGPNDDPFLYEKASGGTRLLIGHHDDEDDLPRNSEETALLGDPRNDENIFISQLHLTMLKFHNAVLEQVTPAARRGSETDFEAAQRIVRWHYQWMVLHDFLPRVVGADALRTVFDDSGGLPVVHRRFYDWRNAPYMPVEFSVAAYRFGHSMIRPGYKLNTFVPPLPIFTPDPIPDHRLSSFGGFRILPPLWTIEWRRFFDVAGAGDGALQHSRLIDSKLADPLAALPPSVASSPDSLIVRNLTRGARLGLPSGQAVARHLGLPVLTEDELGLTGEVPLWYYLLKEAEVRTGGAHLGEVGGLIVAEVFLGLLEKDPSSYLRNDPLFRPFLGAQEGVFTMPDLITVAGHGLGVIAPPPRPPAPPAPPARPGPPA
jgi:Animal haem peroxidase